MMEPQTLDALLEERYRECQSDSDFRAYANDLQEILRQQGRNASVLKMLQRISDRTGMPYRTLCRISLVFAFYEGD